MNSLFYENMAFAEDGAADPLETAFERLRQALRAATGPLDHPIIMAGCVTVLCGSIPPAKMVRRMREPDALALWIHKKLACRN